MSSDLIGRLTALGRAHDLVRPLPGNEGKAALLGDLFAVLLAPYDDTGAFAGRIRVALPRMGVGERTARTLALVIHELATNSLKHGALSADTGALDVSSTTDEWDLFVVWAETGGPEIVCAPDMLGFGSKLLSRSIWESLDGGISYEWRASGLVATMRMRKDRLAA